MAESKKDQVKLMLGLMIIGPILFISILIFTLTLYGTMDLLIWTVYITYGIILIGIICFLVTIFGIIEIKKLKAENKTIIPSRHIKVLGIISIILPSILIGMVGIAPAMRAGDKAPQLLIADGTGDNGVPNMAVTFWTKSATMNTFAYSSNKDILLESNPETIKSKSHVFPLLNLDPDTTYYYQINEEGIIYNFTTMSASDDDFRFGISSDCHFGAGSNNKTATLNILKTVVDNGYDSFFALGDFVEYGMLDSMWADALNSMSPYTSSIPFRPAVGNHDAMIGGMSKWKEYFYPEEMATDTGSRQYYHIGFQNVHVFVLDLEWDTATYTAEQKAWFETELAKVSNDEWVIVMNHAMYYTSGISLAGQNWWDLENMITEFEDLFIAHDVDLVFSGHNHHLEALEVNDIFYGIVGGFGGHADPEREVNGTNSIWYDQGQHGFADVDISGTSATITFRGPENQVLFSTTVTE